MCIQECFLMGSVSILYKTFPTLQHILLTSLRMGKRNLWNPTFLSRQFVFYGEAPDPQQTQGPSPVFTSPSWIYGFALMDSKEAISFKQPFPKLPAVSQMPSQATTSMSSSRPFMYQIQGCKGQYQTRLGGGRFTYRIPLHQVQQGCFSPVRRHQAWGRSAGLFSFSSLGKADAQRSWGQRTQWQFKKVLNPRS